MATTHWLCENFVKINEICFFNVFLVTSQSVISLILVAGDRALRLDTLLLQPDPKKIECKF